MITHVHHIIPKHEWIDRFGSLIGVNCQDNLVSLTPEQHAEAHKLLWELNGRWEDKIAYQVLYGQISVIEATLSAIRVSNRKRKGEKRSEIARENIRLGQLGSVKSQETRDKISRSRIGQVNNPTGSHTIKSRSDISKFMKTRVGDLNPFFGKKHSIATKMKISESKRKKKIKENEQ